MSEDFVWVFKRPDSDKVAQIPAAPDVEREDALWWSVMLLLLQIYGAVS